MPIFLVEFHLTKPPHVRIPRLHLSQGRLQRREAEEIPRVPAADNGHEAQAQPALAVEQNQAPPVSTGSVRKFQPVPVKHKLKLVEM